MNSEAKDRNALAAATRSDVNGLNRLPERQLLPQIRRSRAHIEMTGVRPKAKLLAPRTLGHCRPVAALPVGSRYGRNAHMNGPSRTAGACGNLVRGRPPTVDATLALS
jgi:hypothetical protein